MTAISHPHMTPAQRCVFVSAFAVFKSKRQPFDRYHSIYAYLATVCVLRNAMRLFLPLCLSLCLTTVADIRSIPWELYTQNTSLTNTHKTSRRHIRLRDKPGRCDKCRTMSIFLKTVKSQLVVCDVLDKT